MATRRLKIIRLAPMNVKVGVLNNVDFQLVLSPYQWQRIKDKTTGAVEKDSGLRRHHSARQGQLDGQ